VALVLVVAATTAAIAAALPASDQGRSDRPAVTPPQRSPKVHPKLPRRPQFVTVSFDGSGTADLWRYWRRVGRRTGARFTFFLSGVYLLGEERRSTYVPPRHRPGSSDIGFTQRHGALSSRKQIAELLEQLAAGRREGHEIGTHFNGHFCRPYSGSVGEWTANDWRQEITQFDEFLARASALNGIDPSIDLGFGPADIVGTRTPCLEGDLDVLHRVLRERGFRYDSSTSALLGTWPKRRAGIWSFPLPEIRLVGTSFRVIAMDYNLFVNQQRSPSAEQVDEVERQALPSYLNAFGESYYGARAPFAIGYHFERWNDGAYVRALTRFLERVCHLRDVRCVPYSEVANWLDLRRKAQASRSTTTTR
jgi:hypothetical protein